MNEQEINPSYQIEHYKLSYRACIPFYILLDKDLSKNELALYGLIEQMESGHAYVFYNNRKLAMLLGVSHESNMISRMCRNLKSKGYIKREYKEISIKGKMSFRWCWNTIKCALINDEQGMGNEVELVPEVQVELVPEVQVELVPEVQPYNTLNNKTHYINNIPVSEKTGKNKIIKDYQKDERFMRFYNEYPRKEDPRDAWKAFKSIIGNNDELLESIINDIRMRKEKHTQWKEKKYIKFPAVYLRKGEFLGEIFNEVQELQVKNEQKKIENDKRVLAQEELSKKTADYERTKQIQMGLDAKNYRKIIKNIPEGLSTLKKVISKF